MSWEAMEVSMSKTRRGKYTDNRICYISKCKGDMRLYLRRKGKLPCFSYLVRGKSFSFYRGKVLLFIGKHVPCDDDLRLTCLVGYPRTSAPEPFFRDGLTFPFFSTDIIANI